MPSFRKSFREVKFPERPKFWASRFAQDLFSQDVGGCLGSKGRDCVCLLLMAAFKIDEALRKDRPAIYYVARIRESLGLSHKRDFKQLATLCVEHGWLLLDREHHRSPVMLWPKYPHEPEIVGFGPFPDDYFDGATSEIVAPTEGGIIGATGGTIATTEGGIIGATGGTNFRRDGAINVKNGATSGTIVPCNGANIGATGGTPKNLTKPKPPTSTEIEAAESGREILKKYLFPTVADELARKCNLETVRDVVAEFEYDQNHGRHLNGPGAIAIRLGTGKWPHDSVRSISSIRAAKEASERTRAVELSQQDARKAEDAEFRARKAALESRVGPIFDSLPENEKHEWWLKALGEEGVGEETVAKYLSLEGLRDLHRPDVLGYFEEHQQIKSTKLDPRLHGTKPMLGHDRTADFERK